MRYRLRSVDELRACLCRIPDGIGVEVDRGLAMSAETVADLRSLSTLPPGLVLVIDELEPRFDLSCEARAGLNSSPSPPHCSPPSLTLGRPRTANSYEQTTTR